MYCRGAYNRRGVTDRRKGLVTRRHVAGGYDIPCRTMLSFKIVRNSAVLTRGPPQ